MKLHHRVIADLDLDQPLPVLAAQVKLRRQAYLLGMARLERIPAPWTASPVGHVRRHGRIGARRLA